MSGDEFNEWCKRNHISESARHYIERVRSSPPSRSVQGAKGNLTGRVASIKMGRTISVESGTVEYLAAINYEFRDDVLEAWDQPEAIKITYRSLSSRNTTHHHTPDFLVLTTNGVAWHEWKKEEALAKLAEKYPNRYVRDGERWRCPPGEMVGEQYGIRYELHSSEELHPIVAQNQLFLRPYLKGIGIVTPALAGAVIASVTRTPGIGPLELYRAMPGLRPDDIHRLIVAKHIFFDFQSGRLSEPHEVQLFLDARTAQMYSLASSSTAAVPAVNTVHLSAGHQLSWQGQMWNILNVADGHVALMNPKGELIGLTRSQIMDLITKGHLTGTHPHAALAPPPQAHTLIKSATEEELHTAKQRYDVVRAAELLKQSAQGVTIDADLLEKAHRIIGTQSARAIRYLETLYRRGKQAFGQWAFAALLPKTRQRGNRTSRLSEAQEALIKSAHELHRTTAGQEIEACYNDYTLSSETKKVPVVSLKTFRQRLTLLRSEYDTIVEREGPKAAYGIKPRVLPHHSPLPPHGSHPWERAHIDHYELPDAVFDPVTGMSFGKPWWSVMYSPYARRVLAQFVSLNAPSRIPVLMLFRICVKRFGRLPQILVFDRGPEFSSTDVESVLAAYHVDKLDRPPSEPRFGAPLERFFGITQTQFAQNFRSTTKLLANVRQLPKWMSPFKHASLTLGDAYVALSKFSYQYWDHRPHPALGMTPLEKYELGLAKAHYKDDTFIPYDELFHILTMPHIGKVHIYPGKGARYQYAQWWAPEFHNPHVEHHDFDARENFLDAGSIHVQLGQGQWVEAKCSGHNAFAGRSTRERAIVYQEWLKRSQGHEKRSRPSRTELAKLLREVHHSEDLLKELRRAVEDRVLATSVLHDPMAVPANAYAERFLSNQSMEELVSWIEQWRSTGKPLPVPSQSAPVICPDTSVPQRPTLPPVSFHNPNRYEVQ